MKLLSTRGHRVAAAATAVALAVGGGTAAVAAVASASGSAGSAVLSSATASSTAPATSGHSAGTRRPGRKGHHRGGLLRRTDHATAEVRIKGQWVTLELDRGTVTAVSPSAITLLRPDSRSVTLHIDSTTKFNGATSSTEVKTGERATVISDNGTAERVLQGAGARRGEASAAATSA
jgi:hypothetical protein